MEIVDTGVRAPSFMDFTLPSDFARHTLFYTPQFGHFYCDNAYHIAREHLDLYLLLHICKGELVLQAQGKTSVIHAGETALLDCHMPHCYYCETQVDFLWFHFHGCTSTSYVAYLLERSGMVFPDTAMLKPHFEAVLQYAQQIPANEHRISMHIHTILSLLATPEVSTHVTNDLLAPAMQYIHTHFAEELDLQQLADLCRISGSHLIRCFKRYLNCTPHEYVLSYRLRQAKRLLLSSSDSIERIAELCGFNSASHFARAFRSSNHMSPSAFRTVQF